MIQITVSMTVTWINHVFEYELQTVARFWHLDVAALMTFAGIRAANNFDFATIAGRSTIQLTASMANLLVGEATAPEIPRVPALMCGGEPIKRCKELRPNYVQISPSANYNQEVPAK